jgi:hypothetical protein
MAETKKHWRDLLKKEYLHGSEIDGEITVTIKGFEEIEVYSKSNKGIEELGVMTFEEDIKSVVLTSRKADAIENLYGSGYIDDWIGKKITLFPQNEKHFGKIHPVITVRGKIPESTKLPELVKGSEKWIEAEKSLKYGTVTIESILKFYSVGKKELVELKKLVKK